MAVEDENPVTPAPIPRPSGVVSETSSCHLPGAPSPANPNPNDTSPSKPSNPREFILSVASKIASQPLQNSDPNVWGVLTAISNNARKRQQGINILLTSDEHCIGRLVDDVRFQIDSISVSSTHCRIYRMECTNENMESTTSIFLKDMSTNGTFLNWEKLTKNSAAVKVCHGDILSFAAPPQSERAYAFVYREVLKSAPVPENVIAKRKPEECVSENKRLKGLGIGAPEGPISLDDFRSLQRSNTELRKQLENQVVLIETLRNENRSAVERHESELKSVKESVVKCYLDQLKELQKMVDLKQKELGEINRFAAEQKHIMEDLNERLNASMQSCTEANAIINSQKVNIAELKEQLNEEQSQRKEEREKAATDLKTAVQRAQSEAQEELKRLSDAALRRERELQEAINKLQESERERCLLVETLRSKLEDTRQKLVVSDNKVRQLETQVHDEQQASANHIKKVEELEQETRRLGKELESEKAAREEAWAKVSVLELEINATMRDLEFERRRFKAAREKLMLRETQLRAFYSTTEEIQLLFAKQQEQLKAMQRTLEDEENYENTSVDMDGVIEQVETSSNEASVTEKHDCDERSEECQNTQESALNECDALVGDTMQFDDDNTPSSDAAAAANKRNSERQALNQERGDGGSSSDSDTESCSNTGDGVGVNAKGGSISDAETEGSDHVEEDQKQVRDLSFMLSFTLSSVSFGLLQKQSDGDDYSISSCENYIIISKLSTLLDYNYQIIFQQSYHIKSISTSFSLKSKVLTSWGFIMGVEVIVSNKMNLKMEKGFYNIIVDYTNIYLPLVVVQVYIDFGGSNTRNDHTQITFPPISRLGNFHVKIKEKIKGHDDREEDEAKMAKSYVESDRYFILGS
ncbi:myosin-9 isoform X2 [Senna tora]|uniref:Myosin-9 isoform X2 n=1 Tax=Senna tora TaxID=362788 RepID=A0A834TNS3_9FABA|nr:myosin-9 isoform X2 [Senna tora]